MSLTHDAELSGEDLRDAEENAAAEETWGDDLERCFHPYGGHPKGCAGGFYKVRNEAISCGWHVGSDWSEAGEIMDGHCEHCNTSFIHRRSARQIPAYARTSVDMQTWDIELQELIFAKA